jgi:Glycosyl transferase family 2
MSIIVRDEADIIAHNIEYHRRMGVDRFIVIDHRSVDGTTEILRHFESEGILTLIRKGREIYPELLWTNALIRKAWRMHGHVWHIGNDADEFYIPPAGHTLKTYLETQIAERALGVARGNVIFSQEAIAEHGWREAPAYVSTKGVKEGHSIADPAVVLELPQTYYHVKGKVTFQPATFRTASVGCHRVVLRPRARPAACDLKILHFPARSIEESVRSAVRLGTSVTTHHKTANSSGRYRRWLKMAGAGVADQQIYDEILPNDARLQRDAAAGLLVPFEYPEALRAVLALTPQDIVSAPAALPAQV